MSKVDEFSETTNTALTERCNTTKQSLEQLRSFAGAVVSESSEMKLKVEKSGGDFLTKVSEVETTNATSMNNIASCCVQMLHANQEQSSMMTALSQERDTCLRDSLSSALIQLGSTHETVDAANTKLQQEGDTHAAEHESTLTNMESLVNTHVTMSTTPLMVTGNTPEKRKFDRPDEFIQTREHTLIMNEAKSKRSKQCPVIEESIPTVSTPSLKRELSGIESTENPCSVTSSRKNKSRSSSSKLPANQDSKGEVVKNPLMEATNLME